MSELEEAGPFGAAPDEMEAAPEPDAEPEPDEPDKPFNWYGLRNTEADVDPDEVKRQLAPEIGPRGHAIMGASKQVGAGGVEAWMHYVVAIYLFVDPQGDLLPSDSSDEQEDGADRAERWGDVDE